MPTSYLVDTNIIVDSLRQNSAAQEYLDSLKSWSYSVISAMEIFAGARDKKEISALEKFFAAYREVPLSGDIGTKGRDIMKTYAKSEGLDPMDALIAATAVSEDLTLVTRNRKHFRAIKGLSLEAPDYR
jgi:predicted nucleic acid-binding protein